MKQNNNHKEPISQIVLASSSPRRKELAQLLALSLPVSVFPTDVDETTPLDWTPAHIVEQLSLRKASAAAAMLKNRSGHEPSLVIGADTIVVCNGVVLGKPSDDEEAAAMLSQLQGQWHEVYTGVACVRSDMEEASYAEPVDQGGNFDNTMHFGDIGQYRSLSKMPDHQLEIMVGYTVSKVVFRPMSSQEIESYVSTGEPLDKAGAYGVQGLGSIFIEKIEGDFYSIMGLPLNLLYQMFQKFGISLFERNL